ncbi:hypothetical protein EZ428_11385 [Pedobacter frigiditerrae]|uniref:Uncharacterized protein n=1 Tax=Pedobacter frigiditerrae TaxID=2530452 RepID=A0A4R0MYC4_9SPHI|nr:hypothetical protein [Pedobacter frigiditerrae]TCC92321.1 hypothetical protein EZ428_11385 [Pedobacter frigiditerrae]
MIPSILQLSGSILLAIMTFLRNTNQIQMYAGIVLVQKRGVINPKLKEILKETFLFRVGLAYICFGYIFQIGEVDYKIDIISKTCDSILLTLLITTLGYFASSLFAKFKFNRLEPFDPEKGNHPDGSIFIEDEK